MISGTMLRRYTMTLLFVKFVCVCFLSTVPGRTETLILSADEKEVFTNETLVLTCSSSAPVKQVQWRRKPKESSHETVVVVHEFVNNICWAPDTTDSLKCDCNSSTMYRCAFRAVSEVNDGDSWRCSVVNEGLIIYSNSYTIRILLRLSTLTLLPPPLSNVSYPIYNATSTFTCLTSKSRPTARIQWFDDDVNITEISQSVDSSDVTTGVLRYTPTSYGNKTVSCMAIYVYKHITVTLRNTTYVQIQYPVSKPIVAINNINVSEEVIIRENVPVELSCYSTGYPTPSYNWTYPGGKASGKVVRLQFDRTANTKQIQCVATNTYNTLNGVTSTHETSATSSLTMNVLYSPRFVHFVKKGDGYTFTDTNISVVKGDTINISCEWDANPPANVSWQGQQMYSSLLTVRNIQQDTTWTCRAFNFYSDESGQEIQENEAQPMSISVLYPPLADKIENQTALLNASVSIGCKISKVGNPPETSYTWFRKRSNMIVGTKQTLTIVNVELSDEGEYGCNATNIMQSVGSDTVSGVSQATFHLDVQYQATIHTFQANGSKSKIIIDEGEAIEIVCDADGDPTPLVRIIHATRGSESLLIEKGSKKVNLYILRVRCENDSGVYTCQAYNKYNIEQYKKTLDVNVNCSPRPSPFSPATRILYRTPNDTAIFTFTIIAHPEPETTDFNWYKRVGNSWAALSNENRIFSITKTNLQTQLFISRVQVDDFTDFMVNVSNIFGSTEYIFTLHEQTKPDVPKDLHILRVGETDIDIAWVPGFNGGDDQNFIIRYKKVHAEKWIFVFTARLSLSSALTLWGLQPGATYDIQLRAENKIGQSDWTEGITQTTKMDPVGVGSSPFVVGGAVGGVLGIVLIIAVSFLIWRYKSNVAGQMEAKRSQPNINMTAPYENLSREICSTYSSLAESRSENSKIDSSAVHHANQYETVAELELREYSSLATVELRTDSTSARGNSTAVETTVPSTDSLQYENTKLS